MIKKIFNTLVVIAFMLTTTGFPLVATAAQFTGVKDTLSTVTVNTTATHTLTWTLVGGDTIATGETFAIDYVNADFTLNSAGTWQTSDFALSDGTRTNQAPVAVGASPSCSAGANNYTVAIDATNNTFTITTCTSWSASGSNASVTFTIYGTAATGNGTMTNKATDVDSSTYTITESNGDTATGAVVAETNATVSITATVSPTLTFSNDDNAIGFGTLTSGAARWANAAASGSASTTTANTLTVGTNAPSGYSVTYYGDTLKSGANSIAAATISGDADGTPGTAQFALGVTVTGTGSASSGYETGSNNYNFVVNTVSPVATASAPASSDSIAVRYLANIPASQASGSYSTSLDYVATGNF